MYSEVRAHIVVVLVLVLLRSLLPPLLLTRYDMTINLTKIHWQGWTPSDGLELNLCRVSASVFAQPGLLLLFCHLSPYYMVIYCMHRTRKLAAPSFEKGGEGCH
ncbi:hypothetical protein V8E52_003088 [Russula decolorans]|jgi:hypothetical protein